MNSKLLTTGVESATPSHSGEVAMLPHKPHARGCFNAAAIRAVLVASASLLAPPGLPQDKRPPPEVTQFRRGRHAAPAAKPTAYDGAPPPLFDNLGQHTWPI